MSILAEKIKQCKSLEEVARLVGEGSVGATLHILILRDVEVMQQQLKTTKSAIALLNNCIANLEIQVHELAEELSQRNHT